MPRFGNNSEKPNTKDNKIKIFEGKKVRTSWDDKAEKTYYSIVDVIAILTESVDPFAYWRKLKQRLLIEGNETVTNCHALKMLAADGKMRETDVADTEGIFRLTQSIPSKKAEPFKMWLAKVGYERLQEIENPELAQQRMKDIYEKKGYSKSWIDKRLRGIAVRQDLTDEWKNRGVERQSDFAILTNDIMKATFDKDVKEYKDFKNLNRENLRDHMGDIELILTMLGEATTTKFTRERDSEKFIELRKDAVEGGTVAGNARKEIEQKSGDIITKENYLKTKEKDKRKTKKKKKLLEVGVN